jgi:hypothetical protein
MDKKTCELVERTDGIVNSMRVGRLILLNKIKIIKKKSEKLNYQEFWKCALVYHHRRRLWEHQRHLLFVFLMYQQELFVFFDISLVDF